MELAMTSLAIAGTLAGTFLGSWLQSRQLREQHRHEDRTRFHAVRLEAYSTFLAVLRKFTVFVYRWRNRLASPLIAEERKLIDALQEDLWVTVERLALLGSADVTGAAEEMYSDVNLLVPQMLESPSDKERLDVLNAFLSTFFRKRDSLRAAMRADLDLVRLGHAERF